jgi:acyl-CoA thioesterase FadM
MSLSFRRPARVGEPLRGVGTVTRMRSRAIEAEATIFEQSSGDVVAEAEGRFIRVSREQAQEWSSAYGADGDSSAFGEAMSRRATQ